MRVALFEIRHREEIPVEVAIDEAVAITRRYCGDRRAGLRQRRALGDRPRGRGREGGIGVSAEGRGITELNEAAARLDRIAAELADPATTDAAAVELAQEAARIAADAGTTAAEAARVAAERGSESS